jgi:hypothetical protein
VALLEAVESLMPDQKMLELCRKISTEMNPEKMADLVNELINLLNEEQDVIKAKIRANIGNHVGTAE